MRIQMALAANANCFMAEQGQRSLGRRQTALGIAAVKLQAIK